MKNYINILFFAALLVVVSCDDSVDSDLYGSGSNIAGFVLKTQNISAVADGDDKTAEVKMEIIGPRRAEVTTDVTVNISVDPASTAVEGTHYTLSASSIVLGPSGNLLGKLPITIITAGIVPPLAVAPTIILNVESVSGSPVVIGTGRQLVMSIIYQCFADLTGTYLVENNAGCGTSVLSDISQNADGSWHLEIGDGGFLGWGCTGNPGLNNWANIVELCGEILPSNDLQFVPCCSIGNIGGGSWDSVNGILTMDHTQDFTGNWDASWSSTYTRQ